MGSRIIRTVVIFTLVFCASCSRKDLDGVGLVEVSEHVYAFVARGASADEGLGANSGFVVGENGVLVVDSRYTPPLAGELLEAIRSVTAAPLLYLVNTHYHPDHTWGNSLFRDEGAVIIARPETRRDLEMYTPVYLNYYKKRNPEAYEKLKDIDTALPDSTFESELSLDLGGVVVVLNYFGPGHTAGDCIVSIPQERISFAGGLLSNGYHPNLGDPGMDLDNWLEILTRLERMKLHYIVPGQGRVCAPGALKRQRDYILTLRELCREEIRRSTPIDMAAMSVTIPGTEDYLMASILPFNVQAVYRREILNVVKPDFRFDLPREFTITDGGGEPERGQVRWSSQSGDGYMEIEVQWKPTSRHQVIVQDIHDQIALYCGLSGEYEMQVDGSKMLDIGGGKAVAAYGRWAYKKGAVTTGGGVWTWAMILSGGREYSIKLATNANYDRERERRNIEVLESIASTFQTVSR